MLALLAAIALQSAEGARAESLLSTGALREARTIAERLVLGAPRDPHAHLLLARIHFAWPVVGRYAALEHARAAARLAPHDPEPLYVQVQVGYYLGSDEGEGMARGAILKILALDPDYRDVWSRFEQLYYDEAILRKAERALARHPDHASALERRAGIALKLGEPARADSLAALAARGGPSASAFVLRAEAAFVRGFDSLGQAWHDSAVAHAAADSAEALWARASMIANPEEVARYAGTPPGQRMEFFRWFWGARDPNLVTTSNERLGEHVRRVAEARRLYRLLHPFRSVYRSPEARALAWFDERRRLGDIARATPDAVNEGLSDVDRAVARVATLDYQEFQDSAATSALRTGLDARGLTFVRHGKPDVQVACTPDPRYASGAHGCEGILDSEGWLYRTPEGMFSVHFSRAEWFQPVSRGQLRSTRALLRSDRTSVPAPLETNAVSAFFAGASVGHTDAYFLAGGDTAALALWDARGREVLRTGGRRLLSAAAPAGRYRFGLDIDSAGVLGRTRGEVVLPWFGAGELALSSLVLAPGTRAATRAAVVAAMPPDLAFPAGGPLVAYAEIYGLSNDALGRARYRARYTFAPERSFVGRVLRGADPVTFEFEREADARTTIAERLVLEPGRVPAGRYRVTLVVTDLLQNVKSETVTITVTIH